MTLMVWIVHAVFLGLVIAGVVFACRAIWSYSRAFGLIVWLGVVLRVTTGLGFLAISYWNSPLFRGVHTGDGFWVLAPDARVYYGFAAKIGQGSPLSSLFEAPSPFFIAALGLWFRAAGATLTNAVVFNAVCYVLTSVVIVSGLRDIGERRGSSPLGIVVLSSFAFSPILVMTSTQVLKDPLFSFLIVLACVAALKIFNLLNAFPKSGRGLAGWVAAACIAVYGISGIRSYYSIFLWVGCLAATIVLAYASPKGFRLKRGGLGLVVLALLWLAFMVGSGPFYQSYEALATRFLRMGNSRGDATAASSGDTQRASVEPDFGFFGATIFSLREGFVRSGGGTNISASTAERIGGSALRLLEDVGVGAAAMVVPISALQAMSVVSLHGGRGFLSVTDLDTLFLDLTLFAGWVVIYRESLVPKAAGFVFLVVVAGVCALLLAYVVTNFGTLVRLRLLTVVPAWVAPLAFARRPHASPLEFT
jgi:hypothetical protein